MGLHVLEVRDRLGEVEATDGGSGLPARVPSSVPALRCASSDERSRKAVGRAESDVPGVLEVHSEVGSLGDTEGLAVTDRLGNSVFPLREGNNRQQPLPNDS